MAKTSLLLCFDAFGTLFKPRRPVAQQYLEVAAAFGMTGIAQDALDTTLKDALKFMRRRHPNYGKATGLSPETWWTEVINRTFRPFCNGQALPRELAAILLRRFSSSEGYALTDANISATIKQLKERQHGRLFDKLIVGVISNSDDRVPLVLASLGLGIGPLRNGLQQSSPNAGEQPYDIDFHCLSYDVGFEKPNERIFRAAEDLCRHACTGQDGIRTDDEALMTWHKVLVGDDVAADADGALKAGWHAVYLTTNLELGSPSDAEAQAAAWPALEAEKESLDELFANPAQPITATLAGFLQWLLARS
jgi:FMN phosphatase YigB (HAD superfamily)